MGRIVLAVFLLLTHTACSERRPMPAGAGETDTAKKAEMDEKGEKMSENTKEKGARKRAGNRIEGAFSPQVAGSFYTENPAKLREEVALYLRAATPVSELADRDIVGIIAPHAGYIYSGPVAGQAYGQVRGRGYETVVVMALSHRRASQKGAVLNRSAYDTPLGSIEIDRQLVNTLLGTHGEVFDDNESVFVGEHSLEVQLPFLQVALPDAKVVPIIIAVRDDDTIARMGASLYEVLKNRKDVLFVISSDMSHFLPYEKAVALDNRTLDFLTDWNLEAWHGAASKQVEGMCGVRPIQAFTSLFGRYESGKRKVSRIAYQNSGDTAGDKSRVVGYGSVAFSLEKGIRMETGKKDFGPFDKEHRKYLTDLAKKAVTAAARGEKFEPDEPAAKLLSDKGAAFVTLKKGGQLRGCIGHVIARIPLFECVSSVAKAAAIHDTRFSPVGPDELAQLEFEISVLTTPEPIRPEDVVVGRDGLIMSRGGRSGLLLPQVPIEWNWDREQFLSSTCRKAGLPLDCWKDPGTTIEAFQAIVWGEDDL